MTVFWIFICFVFCIFCKEVLNTYITFFVIVCSKNDALECMKSFSGLLRSGGALIIDHRNFHPMIHKGKVNKNGFNPCTLVSLAWVCSLICSWTEHTCLLTVIPNCLVEYILISEAELLLGIDKEKVGFLQQKFLYWPLYCSIVAICSDFSTNLSWITPAPP